MSTKWLQKLRLTRPDLGEVADAQPRRGPESAGEQTTSTSSSSEGSSDTEQEQTEVAKKEREVFESVGMTKKTRSSDAIVAELAQEKMRAAAERDDAMEV